MIVVGGGVGELAHTQTKRRTTVFDYPILQYYQVPSHGNHGTVRGVRVVLVSCQGRLHCIQ
jgi:hypothetical protein